MITKIPNSFLYHGSVLYNADSIESYGLVAKQDYVYMTDDIHVAQREGSKHGQPVTICIIDAVEMYKDGFEFYYDNEEWVTKYVPSNYLVQVQIENDNDFELIEQFAKQLFGNR